MLVRRRRRRANIGPTLVQCIVLAGMLLLCWTGGFGILLTTFFSDIASSKNFSVKAALQIIHPPTVSGYFWFSLSPHFLLYLFFHVIHHLQILLQLPWINTFAVFHFSIDITIKVSRHLKHMSRKANMHIIFHIYHLGDLLRSFWIQHDLFFSMHSIHI